MLDTVAVHKENVKSDAKCFVENIVKVLNEIDSVNEENLSAFKQMYMQEFRT